MRTSKFWTIDQPIIGGVQPYRPARYLKESSAQAYKDAVIRRYEGYVNLMEKNIPVGTKTLDQLRKELEEVKAWVLVPPEEA